MSESVHDVDAPRSAGRAIAVQLRGVRRVFEGGVVAVERLDLDVRAGEFVALLGPSGCGKSTLLRLIAHLDQPNQGSITWRESTSLTASSNADTAIGRDRKPAPGTMAYVFQDAHLLPWRTVLRNVMLPLELRGRTSGAGAGATESGDFRQRAESALVQVGLQEALHRYPAQLSGGMRMRASLARALVTEPAMLLLDEPFAALDEITRQGLDEQLRELWLRKQMTVVFVTHAIHEATFLAQRAVVLSRRPARVVLDHAIDLPVQRDGLLRTTAEFAGQTRVLFEALVKGETLP